MPKFKKNPNAMGSPYKMNGFSGFGNSPLKDKMEYGPYSYYHNNTQKATDSHYGDPHGPKPTSEKNTEIAGELLAKGLKTAINSKTKKL